MEKFLKAFIKTLSTALGFGFYLLVTSTLLVAWFSPDYTAQIQLTPVDLVLKEPFLVLALAPIMTYGTIATLTKESEKEAEE